MGKNDIYMKRWLSDKERFTDLINGSMFQGRKVFSPETLRVENTDQGMVLKNSDGRRITIQRYRDIAMSAEDGTRIVILACENQEEVHYAMPVRGMLYDALTYAEQVLNIRQERREKKDLKGNAEFLSGLKRSDLLHPVITVVLYYGEEEWDGKKELHGLLGMDREEYKLLKKYVPNYRINLIDPRQLENLDCFQTDLQIVFGMLKYRKSKSGLKKYVNSNREYFSNIDTDSYNAVRAILGSERGLKEIKQKSGGIDMCQALEDLYQEGIEQGIEQGIRAFILDYIEEGYNREKILEKLQKRFSLSGEKAEAYFKEVEDGSL